MFALLTIQLEALLFTAREAETQVGIEEERVITPKAGMRPGVRGQVWIDTCHDEWQVNVSYLHYHGRTTEELVGRFEPSRGHDGTIANGLRNRWRVHLGFLDVGLERAWPTACYLSLTPWVGFCIAGVRHKSRVIYREDVETDLSRKEKFFGVGPRFGLKALWNVCGGWSIFSRGASSIVFGSWYLHEDEDGRSTLKLLDEYWQSQKMLEAALGAQFSKGPFYLRGGFEIQLFNMVLYGWTLGGGVCF